MSQQEQAQKDESGCCQSQDAKKVSPVADAVPASEKKDSEGSCATGGCGCG